eukprot:TRINITY_DN17415_c0_g1_i1.p1 TRINITY_DN17415_c0_g1~~TRINITY_DN17415_c0_g1_i1.p1  ORF type:complete len:678 (+),score=315.99 TRINITY_DN17415_c0_g1_i1:75-2036(+)
MMIYAGAAAVGAVVFVYDYPLWVCALPLLVAAIMSFASEALEKMFFGSVKTVPPPVGKRTASVKAKEDAGKPRITVIFGSQTGNAELYANNLGREAKKLGFNVQVHDASSYDQESLHEEKFVVLLMSTYGEGEPTDTAKDFYDWMMCEDRGCDMNGFEEVNFTVFGLGDSQYKHFCQMGIEFDRRLGELGAKRVHTLGTGDMDANMEEDFDNWKQDMWQKATAKFGLEARDEFADAPEQQMAIKRHPPAKDAPKPFPVTSSTLPPSQKIPCWGTITRNDELLNCTDNRSTRHIEIDCTGTGLPAYEAGDHLGILPSNSDATVDEYMKLLEPETGSDILSLTMTTSQRNQLPNKVDVRTALKWYFDLQGVPKKSVLRAFTHFTADKAEQDEFRSLLRVSEESSAKYHVAVKKARTTAGFLRMFPSTKVPLDLFYEMMPRVQPRWYSIASDSLFHGKSVHLCLAVSEGGLCSEYLKDKPVGATVPCFIRKSTFHLPTRDKKRPMLMIGPGTGVAPMIGFLHRKLKWSEQGAELGPCRFYFGCRKRSEDYIYSDLMERCADKGIITALRVAFSRDQAEKVYVQHLIEQDAKDIWQIINSDGNIYICGDAKNMARAVEEALVQVMIGEGGMSRENAEARLNKMEKNQRYLKDVWTSH